MDPKKAREILTDRSHNITTTHHEDLIDALKVGIQAITYVERLCACSLEIRKGWHRLQNPIIDTHRSEHTIKKILESREVRK